MNLKEAIAGLIEDPDHTAGFRVGDEELFVDRNTINRDRTIIILWNRKRKVTNDDLEVVREVLTEKNYREVKSWASYAGQSWLSNGVFTGVSFEVAPNE